MKNEPQTSPAQALALERFAFITRIQELLREGFPLSLALEQVSLRPMTLPDASQRLRARRTIEDWWYDYQHGGFAALSPKERADKGQPRILSPQQQTWVLGQAQAHLAVPVKVLYRRWQEQDPQLPSLNSIYRFLREPELHTKARRAQLRQPLGGATKCFEAPFVNDLWMTDFSPGPYLHPPEGGKAVPTFLCVIIDDHSRLIPYAAYYLRAGTQAFHQTLKEALRRRGLPAKLYTDQGGPFTNDHTRIVCANLGIRLLHAKPYHAWSKGKAERVIFTIQQDFEAGWRLPGQGAANLEELNAKFSLWLQSVYHARVHSATGMSPAERYQRGAHLVKALDPHLDLDPLFYHRLTRTVRRDGTVRLGNHLYEVDLRNRLTLNSTAKSRAATPMKNAPNLELSLLARQWGATAVPFGELSAQAWLETPQSQRALVLLDQTATLRSVMLLAGPNGVGKSALVGRWLSRLDRRLFAPLLLTHASLSGCGLLSALAGKLGKAPSARRETNLALIEGAVAELGKVVPLIVLDEAQSFGYGSLEEVRLLLGLNLAEPPAFGLVLIGDEYLLNTLRLRQHRSLFSRIACQLSLGPWTASLVSQYLQQSLAAVGINRPAIDPAALNLLTSASSGLARSLCLLARAAWIQAASAGAQSIEAAHVQAAIEQVPGAAGLLPRWRSDKLIHFCSAKLIHPL